MSNMSDKNRNQKEENDVHDDASDAGADDNDCYVDGGALDADDNHRPHSPLVLPQSRLYQTKRHRRCAIRCHRNSGTSLMVLMLWWVYYTHVFEVVVMVVVDEEVAIGLL